MARRVSMSRSEPKQNVLCIVDAQLSEIDGFAQCGWPRFNVFVTVRCPAIVEIITFRFCIEFGERHWFVTTKPFPIRPINMLNGSGCEFDLLVIQSRVHRFKPLALAHRQYFPIQLNIFQFMRHGQRWYGQFQVVRRRHRFQMPTILSKSRTDVELVEQFQTKQISTERLCHIKCQNLLVVVRWLVTVTHWHTATTNAAHRQKSVSQDEVGFHRTG